MIGKVRLFSQNANSFSKCRMGWRGILVPGLMMLTCGVALAEEPVASPEPVKKFFLSEDNYDVLYSVEYHRHSTSEGDSRSEQAMLADIYVPKGDGPFPTILMVHGGAWFAGNKAHVSLHARNAADQGFAVVAINYRLAPQHKFPAQLDDCRLALRWIRKNSDKYRFDQSRVAAYGYSAGAHLVCLLAVTQNAESSSKADAAAGSSDDREADMDAPRLRAVVAGGAPCEFSWIPQDSTRLAFWLGGSPAGVPERYAAASPTTFVDREDPPTFFFHGKTDRIVPLSSAETMCELLGKCDVPAKLHVVPGASHMGAFLNPAARDLAIQFLNEQLNVAAKPSSNPGGGQVHAGSR